ncbi:hypothetical protein [Paracoccus sp. KR1-242]|uniref:hypothetical protein n=1 Tax=Paracoccus sp. KR1-242 TaxID=3410028 RepID=UPI003C0B4828
MLWRSFALRSVAAISIASYLTIPAISRSSAQAQPTFLDFPVVIYCEYENITSAYYFSQLGPDGKAIYLSPDRQAGVISTHGHAEHIDGDRVGSCREKSLDELRAAGQAFDLPR